jgi:hypothetical protein
VKSTFQLCASDVMRSAWLTAMWSFHRMNIASGSSFHAGNSDSAVPSRSARIGVEPVVSTAMPATRAATPLPASLSAPAIAASIDSR